jgi:hypothetical protein
LKESESDDDRLTTLWRYAVSRRPDASERKLLKNLLQNSRHEYQESPESAGELLAVGISSRDDTLDAIEHAAWTATARAVLNLRETIGRY